MYKEYRPMFYVSLNAEDNHYYFSGDGNYGGCRQLSPGSFEIRGGAAKVDIEYKACGKSGAVRQRTVLTNAGKDTLDVDVLSSAFLSGIGEGGTKPWNKNRFIIHYTDSCWTGEAQWRHVYAEDAGLYRTYNHNSQSSFRLMSQSSWSTCYHEPVVIIEDTELKKAWYAQIDCGHGWCIDLGISGYRDDISISVLLSDCFERNDGWHKALGPGQSVSTCYSVTGCVDGGFEEAVADLTEARRSYCEAFLPPLCYNDYMNALWALPTKEKTLPLVKAAAEAGCEYYVMDAGWYSVNHNEEKDLGMWEINDELFGEGGLQSIFDEIISAGMKPGIWFEFESAGVESKTVKEHPEYVLHRRGNMIGGRRVLLDFRAAGVREHIRSRIKALYDMGVRFIKNDYNANTGAGIDPDGAQSVHDHAKAFYEFIDSIKAEFPDLLIENCGSGAMRSDMETLSHFDLQSVSDQEDYFRLPSIVSGSEACYPPERCGIWAYPYPTKIDLRQTFVPTKEFADRFKDGKVTVYNMVTGLMGLLYLSGRIECADTFNMSLIKEAAEIYKENRKYTVCSTPVYPTGTFRIDTDTTDSFGLLDKQHRVLTLAVWNNSDKPAVKDIDLKKYTGKNAVLDKVYPRIDGYSAALSGASLHVSLPENKTAIYAVIRF
ncbi:MAG: alpha-galactosidase [Clostridia bacterium]|nr:alpha-galactosidase [Clostridia bacterium]